MLISSSKLFSVFFKAVHHANPGAERKWIGSDWFISRELIWMFTNISARNKVSLWTYKSWYSPRFFISDSFQRIFAYLVSVSVMSSMFSLM